MPHSQFHFNCNNFGQLQKETNIKYIYAIYDRVRLSTGAKLHLEFAICRSLCVWVCAGVYALVFFLFACCLFLSCKMHFTFYCALNQKSISVCRLCGLRTVLWTDCGPGTVHVYSRKICQHVWVAGRWTDERVLKPSPSPSPGLNWNWHPKFDNWVEVASSSAAFSNIAITCATRSIHINRVYGLRFPSHSCQVSCCVARANIIQAKCCFPRLPPRQLSAICEFDETQSTAATGL